MVNRKEDNRDLFVTYAYPYLYVFWKQATPSPQEIDALHRIDPALREMPLSEVATMLGNEDWWRLGPFTVDEDANTTETELRSAGFSVQRKMQ